jgi:hypothetical protein
MAKKETNQTQPAQAADAGQHDLAGVAAELRECAFRLEAPAPAGAQAALGDRLKPLLELALKVLPLILQRL